MCWKKNCTGKEYRTHPRCQLHDSEWIETKARFQSIATIFKEVVSHLLSSYNNTLKVQLHPLANTAPLQQVHAHRNRVHCPKALEDPEAGDATQPLEGPNHPLPPSSKNECPSKSHTWTPHKAELCDQMAQCELLNSTDTPWLDKPIATSALLTSSFPMLPVFSVLLTWARQETVTSHLGHVCGHQVSDHDGTDFPCGCQLLLGSIAQGLQGHGQSQTVVRVW